jgi:hypothetical protein
VYPRSLALLTITSALVLAGCGGGAVEDNGGYKAGESALTDTNASATEAEGAQRDALLELTGCWRKSGAVTETYQEDAARAHAPETDEIGAFAWYGSRKARHYASASFGDPGIPTFTWATSNLSADQLTAVKYCVAQYVAAFN